MAVSKASVKKKMQALNVYKPEFDTTIERYVKLSKEFQKLYTEYEDSGFQFEIETEKGTKKAPIVGILETLRRDILAIENSLGLTPMGLLKLQENAFKSAKKAKKDSLV